MKTPIYRCGVPRARALPCWPPRAAVLPPAAGGALPEGAPGGGARHGYCHQCVLPKLELETELCKDFDMLSPTRHYLSGEGPRMGLLRDCKNFFGPSFLALASIF